MLVGHSYGGVVSRLSAHSSPGDVADLVLIDNMTAQEWRTWQPLGTARQKDVADYPDLERLEWDETLAQVRRAKSIQPMPVIVLTS